MTLLEHESLIRWFQPVRSCVVAYSGGLDSSVVAKAAALALGEKALAIMAVGDTSFQGECEKARQLAESIPIRFQAFNSPEMGDPKFTENSPDRCYHCKRIRLGMIQQQAQLEQFDCVVDGSQADDQADFRPGRKALAELGFRSPMQELGFNKQTVRRIAKHWELQNHDQPAMSCLATRIAYGLTINSERLRRIDQAERFLTSLGFQSHRVRLHPDELARIEVLDKQMDRIMQPDIRTAIVKEFHNLGFHYISFDLEGFRSGSMNRGLDLMQS